MSEEINIGDTVWHKVFGKGEVTGLTKGVCVIVKFSEMSLFVPSYKLKKTPPHDPNTLTRGLPKGAI